MALAADKPPCHAPLDVVRLASPLTHVGAKLTRHEAITIVAIGSSSTWGAGASTRDGSYPSRLQAELKVQYPGSPITVLNRGVGGEEVPDMLKRFDEAVIAAKPDLVLWQLGTNSVIRDHLSDQHAGLIREGLMRIRATGADIVLIDPQYAPKVVEKAQAPRMVALIATTAKAENVDLFQRFEVMKRWTETDHLAFGVFTAPDGLHMNDWGYACMAKGLSLAISDAAKRPVLSAKMTAAKTGVPLVTH
jgi:acyl-CoA thioesterase-1